MNELAKNPISLARGSSAGMEPAALFTIARVAEMLGQDRKTVRDQFERAAVAAASATIVVRGQVAQVWPVSAFPPRIGARLKALADVHCYNDVSRFLTAGRQRWSPPVAAGKLPVQQIESARSRCNVLAPILRDRCGAPGADMVAAALPAWKAASGYEVAERTMRRWIERAIDRDLGFSEWERWEIYLDDQVSIARPTAAPTPDDLDTASLNEALSVVALPARPTSDERTKIWAAAMNDTAVCMDAGNDPLLVQRAVLRAIARSGVAVAKNESALRKTYRRKWEAWLAGGELLTAIADKRADAAAAREFTLPAEDQLKLISLARLHGNQLAAAYRVAHQNGSLTAETMAHFPALPRDKSFVPHSIRREVSPFLEPIAVIGRGPRARKLNGAHVVADWSTVEPGDVFEFDDLTLPVYWWIEDPTKPGGFYFGAGQVLMSVDAKTGFILSWILIARPGYNARDIMQLVREVHDSYGLPRQYLLFERGIWKRSRLISGEASERGTDDICGGLQSIWPLRHAHSPTGKAIIERTFGLIQNRMEHLPGYTGRDMRKDCPQATKEAIDAVRAGREHPSKRFLHAQQIMQMLEGVATAHNDEPLGVRSKRIPGLSPKAAFEMREVAGMGHFGPESRHLFTTHRIERKVTIEGIRLPDSLGGAVYRNEETGKRLGQTVLCWVDPLALDSIFITDRERGSPCLIERAEQTAARGAQAESLARAMRQSAAHMRFVDVLTRATKPNLRPSDFRPVLVDGATQRLAADMHRQKAVHDRQRRDTAAMAAEFDELTRRDGLALPKPTDPNRLRAVVDGLKSNETRWDEVSRRAQENVDL